MFAALPVDLSSARHFTTVTLQRWRLFTTVDDAASVVSELMAWAMADPAYDNVWLGLAHHQALLCVVIPGTVPGAAVSGPRTGTVHHLAAGTRHRRRIIDALTDEWGRTRDTHSTILWARVPTRPPTP
ncbi:hypothetical protein [Streptomyces specialis]|uniref:hypothetical protein n=1 Tax=Streptomyces specialis TaxID=498367 RepID=UPI00073E2EA2|nr:hypothetical protein [Streptomyces specialis]